MPDSDRLDYIRRCSPLRALRAAAEKPGGFKGLEDRIARAAGDSRFKIDRRKLKRLVSDNGDEVARVALTLDEWIGIDKFLSKCGYDGLTGSPFFEPRNFIVEKLGRSSTVTFLIGNRPDPKEERNNVSQWDSQCMAELLDTIEDANPSGSSHQIRFEIENISTDATNPAQTSAAYRQRLAEIDQDTSIVSIGSSLANCASELILSRMFRVDPWARGRVLDADLPFRFVWPTESESSFSLNHDDVERFAPSHAAGVKAKREIGLYANGVFYPTPWRQTKSADHHGVIVAQWRKSGKVWLVLFGLTGLATLGCARALRKRKKLQIPLPAPPESSEEDGKEEHGKPIVAVVRSHSIMPDKKHLDGTEGDVRELKRDGFEIIGDITEVDV